ncbi:MAG: hypothetical protein JW699_03025 [Chitinispirillaceae bacterium]|nr:hypothetical protein [Chitinispirillaceae bacterium]
MAMIHAQEEINEAELFADTSSVVDSSSVVNTAAAIRDAQEKNSVGFSGEMFAYANPSFGRAWFDDPAVRDIGFSSRIVGNGLLDMRLVGGTKAFADLEASYVPSGSPAPLSTESTVTAASGAVFSMREMFVDVNYRKTVYLRAGKQVLQWGPCSFWNPTDLVNIERKSFLQKEGHREGSYGLKMHIPYKTLFNFYSFLDVNDADSIANLALSVKAEVLVGRTELALSGWKRDGFDPAFGFDLTTQVFNVQVAAEASLRNGSRKITLEKIDTLWDTTTIGGKWYPRVAVSLTRFFPLAGVADRLIVSSEFYYNHIGYDENVFADPVLGKDLQSLMAGSFFSIDTSHLSGMPWLLNPGIVSGLYEMHSYSKFYAALFASISRFILDDMTFSCNAIGNLNQMSFVVSTGVSYQSLHNFIFGISLNAFLGRENTEYTFSGNGLMVQIRTGIIF